MFPYDDGLVSLLKPSYNMEEEVRHCILGRVFGKRLSPPEGGLVRADWSFLGMHGHSGN